MNFVKKHYIIIISLLFIASFVSCESSFKDIQKINSVTFFPSGDAENINLKYVDSGRIKAILKSPKMLDYQKALYPFTEFPQGIHLTFFDNNFEKNYVVAEYAISYSKTELIELIGNVVITTHDQNKLETDQLFFDQKNNWFFTEGRYRISDNEQNFTQGIGLDSDSQFKVVTAKNSYAESIKKNK